MKKITVKTNHRTEVIDITREVRETIIQSGVKRGLCCISTPHTTASVILFENLDPNLRRDLLAWLHEMIPNNKKYAHIGANADAHLKSALMGSSLTIPIEDGAPLLGKWQGVFFCEFDGPRETRVVNLTIIHG